MNNCSQAFRTSQGLSCHQTRKHTVQDLPYEQPSQAEIRKFKERFILGLYEILGATPRATVGKNHKGKPVCSGHVECDKHIFASLFKNHRTFKWSSDLGSMKVTFKGMDGMRELEAIFGEKFWMFGFKCRSYTYIHFWEPGIERKPAKFVLKCKTKVFSNHYPRSTPTQERIYFNFRKRRDSRTQALHDAAPKFEIPN